MLKRLVNIFSEKQKPNLREIGAVKSKIQYSWDPNPDEVIQKKGIRYLKSVARDTHVSSCLRTRRQKLLKTPWDIFPAAKNDEAIFWAEFAKWNLDNMEGEFLQDLAGMHKAIGFGFSISEINWKIIEDGPYKGMIGIKSIRYKPVENIKFKTDKFGYVTDILLFNNYGFDPVSLPKNKVIHVVYGDNDENPYGDPTLSRVAFWTWLKKNEAQFWAIFSEKFGMPTATAKVPNNATEAQKQAIRDILKNLQAESGIEIPEGFEIGFLEAVRRGEVGYDNFIERCNKEISKEILGQTLSVEEGKRGQGSYALGTVHAATLSDYVAFDAALIQTAVTEQLIWRLMRYNSNTRYLPRFVFVNEIDSLTLVQNFPAISSAIDIPEEWLYRKLAIPMPGPGDRVIRSSSSASLPQKGIDNKAKSVFYEFAESEPKIMQQREAVMKKFDIQALNKLAEEIDAVFQSVFKQFKKKLRESEAIESPPKYAVNVSGIKNTLINSAVYYYCIGKYFAREQIKKHIDIGKPSPIKKFAEFDIDIEFKSPEDAIKFFSGLTNITKKEMETLLALYEERYFTVAGLIQSDIKKIFDNIVIGLEKGWNWPTFENAVNQEKIRYTGEVFGTDLTNEPLKANHLKVIFQNNMMRAYQEGADALYNDPAVDEELWGFMYVAVGDDRTRPSHMKLNGIVRPKDDPFWRKYKPPWDHGCRCDRIPVFRHQIASGEYVKTEKLPQLDPEEGFPTRRI